MIDIARRSANASLVFERHNAALLALGDKGLFASDLRHAAIDGEIHAGDI